MNVQIFDTTLYTIGKLEHMNEREYGFSATISKLAKGAGTTAKKLQSLATSVGKRFGKEESDYEAALENYAKTLYNNAADYYKFISEEAGHFALSVEEHRILLREAKRDVLQYQRLLLKYKRVDIQLNRRLSALDQRILVLTEQGETCCNRTPVDQQIDGLNEKRLRLRKQIGQNLQMLDSLRQRAGEVVATRTQDMMLVQQGQTELYLRFFNAVQESRSQQIRTSVDKPPQEPISDVISVAVASAET